MKPPLDCTQQCKRIFTIFIIANTLYIKQVIIRKFMRNQQKKSDCAFILSQNYIKKKAVIVFGDTITALRKNGKT